MLTPAFAWNWGRAETVNVVICWDTLLRDATETLEKHQVDDAGRKLRWWIADQFDCGLYSIPLQDSVPADLQRAFEAITARLASFEPIQYICGSAPFRDMDLHVTPAVLIPRPETEQLVEIALKEIVRPGDRIADIGTGSGCIAISVKRARPSCQVTAVDVSQEALRIAAKNAEDLGAEIFLHPSDLLSSLHNDSQDVLIANLPYISDEEMKQLPRDVSDFEPCLALAGGPDGTHLIRRLLGDAGRVCSKEGRILLETGELHGQEIQRIAEENGWHWEQRQDAAGRPRFWILHRRLSGLA